MTLNDITQNIFVINMDIAKERWSNVQSELSKIGVSNYERVSGVIFNSGKSRADRVKGCMLSHYNIIKKAYENKLDKILILEDDIEIKEDFNNYLPFVQDFIDNNKWHLFYLGTNAVRQEKMNDYIRHITNALTTHAYFVHSSIYEIYLATYESIQNTSIESDTFLQKYIQTKNKTYGIIPNIIYQRAGHSYIAGAERNYVFMKEFW